MARIVRHNDESVREGTSGAVCNAAVQHPLSTVSPDLNPTIVELQTDAWLVNKGNFISFCRPHPSFITPLAAETSVVLRQGYTKQWTSCGQATLL
ncbi:hypothetical protein TNCV_2689051 [Trichonephila clavipes]|nr:hypothetical protein TNCV_3010751 [Trichonephila clavipes]GFV91442.1 hypothetical protein TNCV_2689051 [Trichonephila clavipes]